MYSVADSEFGRQGTLQIAKDKITLAHRIELLPRPLERTQYNAQMASTATMK
jgi:hypothetical protein